MFHSIDTLQMAIWVSAYRPHAAGLTTTSRRFWTCGRFFLRHQGAGCACDWNQSFL